MVFSLVLIIPVGCVRFSNITINYLLKVEDEPEHLPVHLCILSVSVYPSHPLPASHAGLKYCMVNALHED